MEVVVVPYQSEWEHDFEKERCKIRCIFGDFATAIHHIGSTSIPNILAKPIIDILVEVTNIREVDAYDEKMENIGYECMGEFGIKDRRYFRKSNDANIRTHHVHVFQTESPIAISHIAFRDFLTNHAEKALEYSKLKERLVKENSNNMKAYIDGKDSFIKRIQIEALNWRNKNHNS